ncbi:phosphatidate cytidylyltransferase [Alkaliphilus serpentinus]|uniref:Phosphatidate cytidylyltransferase n=1 Tax=Alkaliphilus serpentinus TaxID=1482731 RepID=A0A833HPY0_9FIRM|nr:phosphatidate cytidylyltransferase [Alkaliphilus serpentinus]KAB3531347.1 phosphatidate cytidylyltransferase [Alkaliphilus serpentinus]
MLKRIISGVLGIPILITVVWYGGYLLYLSLLIVSLIGIHEFYIAFKSKNIHPIRWIGYIITLIILSDFYFSGTQGRILFLLVATTLLISIILLINNKYNIIDGAVTLYGIIYVGIFLGHIILISNSDKEAYIWLAFITAWASDTFAYFAGNFFGKRKLCPTISPKKTVEGAIGGGLGSMLSCGIFGYLVIGENILAIIIIGLIGSIFSMLGDLTASIIKRHIGIKDYGNLIPGHGGILDRFDSILFTAPFVYYAITLLK